MASRRDASTAYITTQRASADNLVRRRPGSSVKPIRVGIVCDLREEGWHSMDLVADMLLEMLPAASGGAVIATRLCPPMIRRWTRLPVVGGGSRARLGDRLTGRLWDYPRWLRPRRDDF